MSEDLRIGVTPAVGAAPFLVLVRRRDGRETRWGAHTVDAARAWRDHQVRAMPGTQASWYRIGSCTDAAPKTVASCPTCGASLAGLLDQCARPYCLAVQTAIEKAAERRFDS